jgi:hypothetical protein
MSKLKTAKAIRKSFTIAGAILKWVGITALLVGIGLGLWAWANAHFLSFAVVIGIVVTFSMIGGIFEAWDWSEKTIEKAEEEEREAQERGRAEKRREEMPSPKPIRTPDFDFDSTDPYGHYR